MLKVGLIPNELDGIKPKYGLILFNTRIYGFEWFKTNIIFIREWRQQLVCYSYIFVRNDFYLNPYQ